MNDMEGASPNYDEICGVLEERLVPVFELLGNRLKAIEDKTGEHDDILYKIVSGFGDAVNEHKKGSYSEMLASKHGPDLDEIGGPYSDLFGKDIKEELLDKLMGGELGEDGIPDFIGGIRAKFDKIRAPAVGGSVMAKEESAPESPTEEIKPEEKPAEEAPESEEPPDMAGKMAKTLGLKMNSPKAPKFSK